MVEKVCHFNMGLSAVLGKDGDPIFCDNPAAIKYDGAWFCAEHYDMIMEGTEYAASQGICSVCNCEFYDGECNCEFYAEEDDE